MDYRIMAAATLANWKRKKLGMPEEDITTLYNNIYGWYIQTEDSNIVNLATYSFISKKVYSFTRDTLEIYKETYFPEDED